MRVQEVTSSKPAKFLVREMHHMLPPTILFVVVFNLLVLTVTVLSDGNTAWGPNHLAATLAAMVCGKAVLIADKLPFFNRYPEHPLIWNAIWKATLYVLVVLAIRVLEAVLSAATGGYGFATGLEEEVVAIQWDKFLLVQFWLVILFFCYAATSELVGAVGRDRILAMFFGPVNVPKDE